MADQLDALLGLDIESDEQARALSAQLRDQQMFNDYFSATSNPDVNAESVRKNKAILKTAQNVGTRRREMARDVVTDDQWGKTHGLAKDRHGLALKTHGLAQAKQKLTQKKYDDERANRSELEGWIGADDIKFNAYRDASGQYFKADGTPANMTGATRDPDAVTAKGYIPSDRGSSGVNEIKVKVDGVDYIYDKAARKLYTTMGDEVTDQSVIDKATKRAITASSDLKFGETLSKGAAEALTDDIKGWNAKTQAVDSYKSILTLLQTDEANTGQIYKQSPTFKTATAALESLREELTLGALDQYQLKPVSDVDIKVLRNSVLPTDMQAPDLAVWVAHKIEATERYLEYEDKILQWKTDNAGRRMSSAQKAEFDEIRDEILYAGGFDPFDPMGGVGDQAAAGGGGADVNAIRAQITDPAELAKFDAAMEARK